MRLVALILTLGSLSAPLLMGCAMQTGEPSADETANQRPDELVAVSGSARPITPLPGSPTSSPAPHPATTTNGGGTSLPPAGPGQTSGSTIEDDNPNPSPWQPHGNANGQ
jgi:hypothetical protein